MSIWAIPLGHYHTSGINLTREVGASFTFSHDYIRQYFLKADREKPKFKIFGSIIIPMVLVLLIVVNLSRPMLRSLLLPLKGENQFIVKGFTKRNLEGESVFINRGEVVTIKSRGLVRSGNFMGYVPPEGS
ncbi:MAG: hypothetical protein KC422_25885, partial [Trueperaceae bacterium]|nr:hypothetical protein [Trueperaceae bacterium]